MNIKSHPEYWSTHKKIWQEEYDNLAPDVRESVAKNPDSSEAKLLDKKVYQSIKRILLSSVE